MLAALGGLLVVDSLVSFLGLRLSFALGALFSATLLVVVALRWGEYSTTDSAAAVVLSVCAVAVDALASRPARALSEKDSPLNLPVFG